MYKLLLVLTIILAIILRFYLLDSLPPGLNIDEASQGYDAYSLLLTGKDQWGKAFPIYFRSAGTFQSPLNTYLTIIPIHIFGLSIFSVRFISAFFGVLIVILTFMIVMQLSNPYRERLALFSALFVTLSPWSIFFSRGAIEANVGLGIFLLSFYFFIYSLKNPKFLILSFILLGVSTYAYHAQKLISVLFIITFLVVFRRFSIKNKKIIFISILLFLILQIPHLLLIGTEAATRRLDQVNYWSKLNGNAFQNGLFVIKKFLSLYSAYLSPKNLFFDPDPQAVRSIPDLSVFYSFMIIPFFIGIRQLVKQLKEPITQLIVVTGFISLVPAALTTEPFYTMRVLPYLWVVTLIISLGMHFLYQNFSLYIGNLFMVAIITLSLFLFYSKYFVLLPYERSINYEYPYIKLSRTTEQLKETGFVVDTARDNPYILFALYKKYSPEEFQKNNGIKNLANYYNNINLSNNIRVANVEFRPIVWYKDVYIEQVLVGDYLVLSTREVNEHKLKLLAESKDLAGNTTIYAYSTDPKTKRAN